MGCHVTAREICEATLECQLTDSEVHGATVGCYLVGSEMYEATRCRLIYSEIYEATVGANSQTVKYLKPRLNAALEIMK